MINSHVTHTLKRPFVSAYSLAHDFYDSLPNPPFPKIDSFTQCLPGYSNVLYAIPRIVGSSFKLIEGISLKEKEMILDASVKLTAGGVSLLNGISQMLFYASLGIKFIDHKYVIRIAHLATYLQAMKVAMVSGTVLCLLEGIFEGNSLKRQLLMTEKKSYGLPILSKDLTKNKNILHSKKALAKHEKRIKKALSDEDFKTFETLKEYFNGKITEDTFNDFKKDYLSFQLTFFKNKYLSSYSDDNENSSRSEKELKANLHHLKNRVGSFARQIMYFEDPNAEGTSEETLIDDILKELNDPRTQEKGILHAETFLRTIKIQRVKKSFIHVLGLINAALSIAGFITLVTSTPVFVPIIIMISSYITWFIRYGMATGWLTSKGYVSFSFTNTIPYEIRYPVFLTKTVFHNTKVTIQNFSSALCYGMC